MITESDKLRKVLSTRLPVVEKETLMQIANESKQTRSQLLRTIVQQYISNYKN